MRKLLCALLGLILTLPVFAACPTGQIEQTYTSATGTVTQNGIPTPTNPIEPTFYTQGDMILRKINDTYYDSYDAATGKITRRVGVKVLDGTENWIKGNVSFATQNTITDFDTSNNWSPICTHGTGILGSITPVANSNQVRCNFNGGVYTLNLSPDFIIYPNIESWKAFLADQYANGTPVTVYYPLATETTEDWAAEQCTSSSSSPIKIATTAYNSARFSPVVTELNDTIATIRDVVTNTINQTKAIADLQANKQTRPDENCPAGKKCLLVEDNDGTPHWYEIIENAYGLPDGYTALEYIQTDGNSWINTGYIPNGKPTIKTKLYAPALATQLWGCRWTPAPTYDTLGAIVGSGGNLTIYYGLYENEEFTVFSGYRAGVVHTFELGESSIIYDGLTTNISRENISSTYSFIVGGFNNNGEINQTGISRIYSMEVKESGNMMLNLIPAKNASGVVGMYDAVSGQFFTNAGTGTFVAGPEI